MYCIQNKNVQINETESMLSTHYCPHDKTQRLINVWNNTYLHIPVINFLKMFPIRYAEVFKSSSHT
jgi:hypothetical protein